MSDLYLDRLGQTYTTACFAKDGDPWRGARILTRPVVDRLRASGLLPLRVVIDLPTSPARDDEDGDRG